MKNKKTVNKKKVFTEPSFKKEDISLNFFYTHRYDWTMPDFQQDGRVLLACKGTGC